MLVLQVSLFESKGYNGSQNISIADCGYLSLYARDWQYPDQAPLTHQGLCCHVEVSSSDCCERLSSVEARRFLKSSELDKLFAEKLPRPSLGHWNNFLRDFLAFFLDKKSLTFVPSSAIFITRLVGKGSRSRRELWDYRSFDNRSQQICPPGHFPAR